MILETFFIDRYLRGILPSVQSIMVRNSTPAYIRAIGRESEKSSNSVVASDKLNVTELPYQEEIRVARQIVISPRLESSALVRFKVAALRIIELRPLIGGKELVKAARCFAKISQLVSLYVLVTRFSNKPAHSSKKNGDRTWQEVHDAMGTIGFEDVKR